MAPLGYIWKMVTTVVTSFTMSPFAEWEHNQQPIGNALRPAEFETHALPIFEPPGSNIDKFQCDYSQSMPDWTPCQTSTDKSCWLKNVKTGKTIDITSNFEDPTLIKGIVRNYTLVVEEHPWNADGIMYPFAKLINGTFPGPLIEACWGDTLNVTVINKLQFNGTSIHWHGLRQLKTMHMDGVNGVTQCPIAPGDTYVYTIDLTQYGSSWLHSHFSVQYADGVQAPLTIHGPTSANYDDAIEPLIISDWGHNSAFGAQFSEGASGVLSRSVVLNGYGNINKFTGNDSANSTVIPLPYEVFFNETVNPDTGKVSYLIRLINTAYESGLVFSIDNHTMQVVEYDFVPVVSNATDGQNVNSILVAIGQRNHVIVDALPQCIPVNGIVPDGCNFWLRVFLAQGCAASNPTNRGPNASELAILRYSNNDKSVPTSLQWPDLNFDCETNYKNFTPVFQWQVPSPANNELSPNGEVFDVNFMTRGTGPYSLAEFSFQDSQHNSSWPFYTTYGNPTFLNLANYAEEWPNGWAVISENYKDTDFVYFILSGRGHPIHLHGHDFAILKVSDDSYDATKKLSCSATSDDLKLYCDNPPRRDVITLPAGYAVIAFKTDNPGVWLLHCHIAFHASGGLAFQIMERQADANKIWPPDGVSSQALNVTRKTCKAWNDWAYDCKNVYPGNINSDNPNLPPVYPSCANATEIQNDSGI